MSSFTGNTFSGQARTFAVQPETLVSLEEKLRHRICPVCVDRDVDGTCSRDERGDCFLFANFPAIVQAIGRTRSEKIDDYVVSIRENICATCSNQDNEGVCQVREQVRCVPDRYLLLIVEAIEEAGTGTLR